MSSATVDRVIAIVADELMMDPATIGPDTDFAAILERASLATMEVIVRIEQEFGVHIPDGAGGALRTVQDLADYVECPEKHLLLRAADRPDLGIVLLRPSEEPRHRG